MIFFCSGWWFIFKGNGCCLLCNVIKVLLMEYNKYKYFVYFSFFCIKWVKMFLRIYNYFVNISMVLVRGR